MNLSTENTFTTISSVVTDYNTTISHGTESSEIEKYFKWFLDLPLIAKILIGGLLLFVLVLLVVLTCCCCRFRRRKNEVHEQTNSEERHYTLPTSQFNGLSRIRKSISKRISIVRLENENNSKKLNKENYINKGSTRKDLSRLPTPPSEQLPERPYLDMESLTKAKDETARENEYEDTDTISDRGYVGPDRVTLPKRTGTHPSVNKLRGTNNLNQSPWYSPPTAVKLQLVPAVSYPEIYNTTCIQCSYNQCTHIPPSYNPSVIPVAMQPGYNVYDTRCFQHPATTVCDCVNNSNRNLVRRQTSQRDVSPYFFQSHGPPCYNESNMQYTEQPTTPLRGRPFFDENDSFEHQTVNENPSVNNLSENEVLYESLDEIEECKDSFSNNGMSNNVYKPLDKPKASKTVTGSKDTSENCNTGLNPTYIGTSNYIKPHMRMSMDLK